MYKWIGCGTYQRRDNTGNTYVIYLAEDLPNGQFRPFTVYSNNRTMVGSFVSVEVYNAALGLKLKIGDDVRPSWGPRGQIEGIEKA